MDIFTGLEAWFKERPKWMQEAARRFLCNGGVNNSDFSELILLCKQEAGISIGSKLPEPQRIPSNLLQKDFLATPLRIESIFDIKGINLLAPRKALEFGHSNLTIIYGETASGKSGYVRILKHASGSRKAGILYGDVFNASPTTQECSFKIRIGDKPKTVKWSPQNGVLNELRSIAIYDRSTASSYINEENEITLEPSVLSFFTDLVTLCGKLQESIQAEISVLVSSKPPLPLDQQDNNLGRWYLNIDASVTEDDITNRTLWKKSHEEELVTLRQKLAEKNPTEKIKQAETRKTSIQSLSQALFAMHNGFSDAECRFFLDIKKDFIKKKKTAEEDANKVFSGAPLKGIGSESWRLLWEQARQYSEEEGYPGIDFPNVSKGAVCALCQQTLCPDACARLRSFETFVKSGLQKEAATAEIRLQSKMDFLNNLILPKPNIELLLDAAGILDENKREKVTAFYEIIKNRHENLKDVEKINGISPLPDTKDLMYLDEKQAAIDQEIEWLKSLLNSVEHTELKKRLKYLITKKTLFLNSQAIRKEVNRLKDLALLQKAVNLADTTALSRKKSELTDKLITAALRERFEAEIKAFGLPDIKVQIVKSKAAYGHVYHKIVLKDIKQPADIKDIMSDGEYRIVSLAAFLADRLHTDGVIFIFDDPITSLDINYEEKIVTRLSHLCKTQQVIVFTHRLTLLSKLKNEAEKAGIDPCIICLRCEPWGTGEAGDLPIHANKPKPSLNKLLNERLAEARKIFSERGKEAYGPYAKSICSDFRIILERLIETCLLKGVVERFRREVQTKNKICKLAKISENDCKFIDELMTKYSKYEHSQPAEAPIALPEPQEFEYDMKKLLEWANEFDKR